MEKTTINGITFRGPGAAIDRVRGIKKDEDRFDLLTDAIIAETEGRTLNRFQAARLGEWEYEQGSLVAELEEESEPDLTEDEMSRLLCKYRGVSYLLPEHQDALVRRVQNEIRKHWKGEA